MPVRTRLIIVVAIVAAVGVALFVSRVKGPFGGMKAAFTAEFLVRPDGYPKLKKYYGLRFPAAPVQMDPGLMYRAAADGAVDVISAFATDGRIPAYGLVILEDDKDFFPPYYAAPVIRKDTLERFPVLADVLGRLGGELDDGQMRKLNYQVDEEGKKAYTVARDRLVSAGLIEEPAEPGSGERGPVVVGAKAFTEQEIIGEMMCIMIETHTNIRVTRRLNLGGTMICFNAIRSGDLDLYAEYTGTALVNILKRDVIKDPDETYKAVKKVFEEKYHLVWLEPFNFNNTFALAMRRKQADALGIKTISDLAAHLRKD